MGRNKYDCAPNPDKKRKRKRNNRLCYKCHQKGHLILDCPLLEKGELIIGGEKVYVVAGIDDKRVNEATHVTEYLTRWVDYPRRSWEAIHNLSGAIETVVAFEVAQARARENILINEVTELNLMLVEARKRDEFLFRVLKPTFID